MGRFGSSRRAPPVFVFRPENGSRGIYDDGREHHPSGTAQRDSSLLFTRPLAERHAQEKYRRGADRDRRFSSQRRPARLAGEPTGTNPHRRAKN